MLLLRAYRRGSVTPLQSAIVAATASILGGMVVVLAQHLTESRRAAAQAAREDRDRRLRIFVDLLGALDVVDSGVGGAMAAGLPYSVPTEPANEVRRLAASAQLVASPKCWAEMKPYVELISMKSNYLSPTVSDSMRREIATRIEALGATTDEGHEAVRQRFLAAARIEVAT